MRSLATILGAFVLGLVPAITFAADAPALFTDAQKAAIEDIMRELLTKKEPELVIKAAQELQTREQKTMAVNSQKAITENHEKLFNDKNSPVGGNPKGDVAIVQFYDYQCGYCKSAEPALAKLLKEDKNVKIIYKEFPIFGENSVKVSKASLASARQGKFHDFHEALMKTQERLNDEAVEKIAKKVGLKVEKLKKDMESESIEKLVQADHALANAIGARGTPSFVIGDKFFPGALSYESLKEAVKEARKESK